MHGNDCTLVSGSQPTSLSAPALYGGSSDEPQIHIRPFQPQDTRLLFGAVQESSDQLCAWMTWCHPNYGVEHCNAFVADSIAAWEKGREFSFAIIDSADGTLLGSVGINQVNLAHNFANLGYWVRGTRTRQGIASEAVKLAARFGFQKLSLSRLALLIPTKNVASQRVAVKAGAQNEGVLRHRLLLAGKLQDAFLYSLVPGDLQLEERHHELEVPA